MISFNFNSQYVVSFTPVFHVNFFGKPSFDSHDIFPDISNYQNIVDIKEIELIKLFNIDIVVLINHFEIKPKIPLFG